MMFKFSYYLKVIKNYFVFLYRKVLVFLNLLKGKQKAVTMLLKDYSIKIKNILVFFKQRLLWFSYKFRFLYFFKIFILGSRSVYIVEGYAIACLVIFCVCC